MYVRSLLRGSSAFYALHLLQRPLVLSQMLVVLTSDLDVSEETRS